MFANQGRRIGPLAPVRRAVCLGNSPTDSMAYLNLLILECKQGSRRQETDYGTRHHEDAGPHRPIEGGDARGRVLTGVAALGTR